MMNSILPIEPSPQRRRRRAFGWSTAAIATLAGTAILTGYLRDGTEQFLAILGGDLMLFDEILPDVLAGCLIGALASLLLPRSRAVCPASRHAAASSGL
jgi:hypothetical protein